jgi:uncharacterized protein
VLTSDAVEPRVTYLVIDGENLDATLGQSILGRRPAADERPRWERVLAHTAAVWGQPVKGLFFLNASSGTCPCRSCRRCSRSGFRPVPLSGRPA